MILNEPSQVTEAFLSKEHRNWPLGKGIAWGCFWLGLGIFAAADSIASAL